MDPATLARHALEAPKRPLTLKEALSSVADFRIDRRKKFPLYEILMIAVCAMIDGAKGPAFGVASLRSVSAASVQQFSVQWEADGSPLPTGRWLLAAGCWNTSAAGRPKVCMVESVVYDKSTGKTTSDAAARRHKRAEARQVGLRRNQREAEGTHMGRRKAAWAHARGVEGRQGRQATDSNPRGLDARALTKEAGALENSAWNTS